MKRKHETPWTNALITPIDIQEQLAGYMNMLQDKQDHYWKVAEFTHSPPPQIGIQYGKKYARITLNNESVHTFVNLKNGDILKAGSWKAPQPNGVRGNIFEKDNGATKVDIYGAVYLI